MLRKGNVVESLFALVAISCCTTGLLELQQHRQQSSLTGLGAAREPTPRGTFFTLQQTGLRLMAACHSS